jgi:lipopolysaccharide export system permease protein
MPRFDRYLLSQLVMLFGFFALVLISVYWVNRAVRLFDQLISDGQSAWVFLEFTALSLPYVIRLVLPVAAFVATIYVTNRLSAESELAVMQATGFSPWRMTRPVLWFGLIVAAMVSALSHVLEPAARSQLAERRGEIASNVTSKFLVAGSFLHPAQAITLYIREISEDTELRDIFLSDARVPSRQTIYTAERAALVRSDTGPKLVMFDGLSQTYDPATRQLTTTRFKDWSYDIGALIGGPGERVPDMSEVATPDLLRADAQVQALTRKPVAALQAEGHERFVQALLGITIPLIGFACLLIGGFSRFGLWRQIALGVFAVIVLTFLQNVAADAARQTDGRWPILYLPNLAGLTLVFFLLAIASGPRRMRRESPGVDLPA